MASESKSGRPALPVRVSFGDGLTARFESLAGPESEGLVIEYRHGNSPSFYPIKMPGLGRVGNVTLRKGIFVGDALLKSWIGAIATNTARRHTVRIEILGEDGKPVTAWTLNNAWPTKVSSTDLKSEGNEVAVESVEVAYETLVISAP